MACLIEQHTVVRDGMHNAFTDLTFWQGSYWISYRKGSRHVSLDGACYLSASEDGRRWSEYPAFKIPGDNRDPKILVLSDERLAMTVPSWIGGQEKRHLQQYVAFSENGRNWTTPRAVYKPHWWLWRVVAFGGKFYSAAYTYRDEKGQVVKERRAEFLVSDDLLEWESLSPIEGVCGGESGVHFFENGEVWVVTRNAGKNSPAFFSRSLPPYDKWQTSSLEMAVHSPVLLDYRGQIFLAGRRKAPQSDPHSLFSVKSPEAMISTVEIWKLERAGATLLLNIPATGDCAYPGLLEDPHGRVCLSYYSEHAYSLGVIPQRFEPQGGHSGETDDQSPRFQRMAQNDIYFAVLDLEAP